jgi:hypothetical protein
MPWLSLPFEDRATMKKASSHFGIRGFPTVVLLNEHGIPFSRDGRNVCVANGANGFPFGRPDPVLAAKQLSKFEHEVAAIYAALGESKENGAKKTLSKANLVAGLERGNVVPAASRDSFATQMLHDIHGAPSDAAASAAQWKAYFKKSVYTNDEKGWSLDFLKGLFALQLL